ncbi:MAG: HAD family hydrolase [Bacteroidales bacterium]|nr:HAD family hydrolase [Bacteroidales bacterium]
MKINSKIKIIAFDADDTLWVNEPFYREIEKKYTDLLADFLPENEINKRLLETETRNIHLYGYGVKGFVLSMIETALQITDNQDNNQLIEKIIALGKELINVPLVLLDGVKESLQEIKQQGIKMVLATKGDLLDQERKLSNSGLENCFDHIEIMSNKNQKDYQKLLNRLSVLPEEFLMVGNSVKSDILPVLALGAYAIHIPYHTTWVHEKVVNTAKDNERFLAIDSISDFLSVIEQNKEWFN